MKLAKTHAGLEFYKNDNFKIIELDGKKVKAPKEWEIRKLKEIARVRYGKALPPTKGNIPAVGSSGVYSYVGKALVEKPTIVIGRKGTAGSVHLIKTPSWPSDTTFYLDIPKEHDEIISLDYLYYWFTFKKLSGEHAKTTLPSLKRQYLENFLVFLPPLEEQKKIAEVLRTIDEAIQAVDEGIAKLERLKKGAMERLLTRGINHTRFKEVELNGRKVRIPEEWDFIELKKITEINKESVDPRRVFPDKEFIYIDIDSVENGTGKIRNPKRVLGKNAPSRARRVVHTNDVIMSTVRPYLKAFALIPEEYDGQVCSTGFAVLTPKKQLLHPHYLLYALFSDNTISQCKSMMVGGQYPALTNTQVGQIRIPLPPLSEQKKIAEILRTIDEAIEAKRAKKEKLERMKKAVMEKLLTGKVRIR